MPDVQQNIVINFEVNDSALAASEKKLVDIGLVQADNAEEFKKANTAILAQAKSLDEIAQSGNKVAGSSATIKKSFTEVTKVINSMGQAFQDEIAKGANDALREAGVSAEEFEAALKHATETTTKSSKSLKQQLKDMTAELARMKVAGEDNSAQYTELAQKAGALKDAIGDANQEIKNFGSDTSTFDGLIQGVQGLAGGFAVVQGAAALFGDESEELQKTLLKVNAAMAILQGLQQIQTVLQKESAVSQLANTIATKGQAAALAAYNVIVGTSTGLLKAFRIALAATGIGLVIVAVIALYEAMKDLDTSLEDANEEIERQNELLDLNAAAIQNTADVDVARAEAAGAAESELTRIRGKALQAQRAATVASINLLAAQRDALDPTTEAWFKLNEEIVKQQGVVAGIDNKIVLAGIALTKNLADEEKKRRDEAAKAAKEAAEKAKEARAAAFADAKARRELELLNTKEGTEEQLQARKNLALAVLQIELNNDKLTANQRRLAAQNFLKDRIKLDTEFYKNQTKLAQENYILEAQTALQQLNLSAQDRLTATELVIGETAQLEIAAAEGNAIKIRAIAAKRDADIRAARLASIEETVQYEISLAEAQNGPEARRLQRVQDNEREALQIRKDAIDQLALLETAAIAKRITALNKELADRLISQKEYDLKYAQLVDQGVKVVEDAEKKKTDLTKAEAKKRQEELVKDVQNALEATSRAVGVLGSFYDADNERRKQQLDEQRQQVKELLDAGVITEKEATARNKRLDVEDRRQKQLEAERQKRIAVFNALLAIPQAFLQGLSQGGIYLAAIYAALAAVQAGVIASRKVPRFARGKKDSYTGPGIVGEAGHELVEQNGRMWVADKEQMIWLNKKDKVYNPRETAAMLSKGRMSNEKGISTTSSHSQFSIDYKRLGKEVGKNVKTDVYVDGVHAQHIEKQAIETYQYKRRQR